MLRPCSTHAPPCSAHAPPMLHHAPPMLHPCSTMLHPCSTMLRPCSTHAPPCSAYAPQHSNDHLEIVWWKSGMEWELSLGRIRTEVGPSSPSHRGAVIEYSSHDGGAFQSIDSRLTVDWQSIDWQIDSRLTDWQIDRLTVDWRITRPNQTNQRTIVTMPPCHNLHVCATWFCATWCHSIFKFEVCFVRIFSVIDHFSIGLGWQSLTTTHHKVTFSPEYFGHIFARQFPTWSFSLDFVHGTFRVGYSSHSIFELLWS